MRLNVNGSFDVKITNTHQTFHWIYFLQTHFFRFVVQKTRPINVESHMYKVTKFERTLVSSLLDKPSIVLKTLIFA